MVSVSLSMGASFTTFEPGSLPGVIHYITGMTLLSFHYMLCLRRVGQKLVASAPFWLGWHVPMGLPPVFLSFSVTPSTAKARRG